MDSFKVIIFSLPATGHVNTILSVANELVKRNVQVIFYCSNDCKSKIEASGAQFRSYKNYSFRNDDTPLLNNKKKNFLFNVLKSSFEATSRMVVDIAKDIDNEKPNIIIYDQFADHAKWAIRMIETYYKTSNNKSIYFKPSSLPPPAIMYLTSFAYQDNAYPNQFERKIGLQLSFFDIISFIYNSIKLTISRYFFCRKYKLNFVNPLVDVFESREQLNLVFVSPELQPRAHLFDKSFKFVGSCIDESVHDDGFKNLVSDNIQKLLAEFPIINPSYNHQISNKSEKTLIYVSFGTLFNNNVDIYSKIIDAFTNFDNEQSTNKSNILFENIVLLITVSKSAYDVIDRSKLPNNIIVEAGVPQLEILKRATIFITHCGMNSASEAVHYGVPMLCLPLHGDQFLVSHRLTYDLGLGIEHEFINLKPTDIRRKIHKLLSDQSYHDRILQYSMFTRKHIGQVNAAKAILELIKQKDQSK